MGGDSKDALRAIEAVVRSRNCSGCGVCATLASNIEMTIDAEGYMRPTRIDVSSLNAGLGADVFQKVCPGREVRWSAAAEQAANYHPIFGHYEAMWEGWSGDPQQRFEGSSGGVITALTAWLLETGRVRAATGVAQSSHNSTTVPVAITTRDEALASAGSRYGPVACGASYALQPDELQIGKPCEILAASSAEAALGRDSAIKLSFFCAGTSSQHTTDNLVQTHLGSSADARVRYRGRGWPGEFVARANGREWRMNYESAWGEHLGRSVQWRCKVCPDGTGVFADVTVGDYWNADKSGYPTFIDGPGTSVVIARTKRGVEIVEAAADAGVIELSQLDLQRLEASQPTQVLRRRTLAGRLLGAALVGRRPPRYRGMGLVRLAVGTPVASVRAAIGTVRRILSGDSGSL